MQLGRFEVHMDDQSRRAIERTPYAERASRPRPHCVLYPSRKRPGE
jgi:hypothetical protein